MLATVVGNNVVSNYVDLLSIYEQLLLVTHDYTATYTQGNFVVGNSCQQQSYFVYGSTDCCKVSLLATFMAD